MNEINLEGFIKLCSLSDLKESKGKRFIVNENEIAVFKVNNIVYALSNICPHQHSALIYDGFVENGFIVCPAHGWMFDLTTGRTPAGSRGLDNYTVKVVDEKVFVKVIKKEFKW